MPQYLCRVKTPHQTSSEDNIFQAQCNDKKEYAHQCNRQRVIPHDCSDVITRSALYEPEVGVSHIGYYTRPGTDKKDEGDRVNCTDNS